MPDLDLDRLAALEAAATPGPWDEFCESGDWWLAQRLPDGAPGPVVCFDTGSVAWAGQPDIDLVAALRNDARALIAAARERDALLARAQRAEAERDALRAAGRVLAETIEAFADEQARRLADPDVAGGDILSLEVLAALTGMYRALAREEPRDA